MRHVTDAIANDPALGVHDVDEPRRGADAERGLMGWGTAEHEGWAADKRADGSWSDSIHRSSDANVVARQAVCSCGWRSQHEHPVPPRPQGVPRDARGLSYGPAWDAWIAALEAAENACHDDWVAEHFDPLLGYEPHTQLIEASDAGGGRHFLDGCPVHAGTTLELLLADGHWLRGRYEWNFSACAAPTFAVALGGPPEAQRQDVTPVVEFALPSRAVLRWPDADRRFVAR